VTVRLDRARPPLEASSGGRRVLAPLGVAAAAAAVVTTVGLLDPNVAGHYPTCPWLALTGTYCPGCGTLRATNALTHGDVGTALARNPLTVISYAVILVGFLNYTVRMWTGRPKQRLAPAWVLYALFWAILAFWVLRNVPGMTWLSPA
jgi:hypothetical protein